MDCDQTYLPAILFVECLVQVLLQGGYHDTGPSRDKDRTQAQDQNGHATPQEQLSCFFLRPFLHLLQFRGGWQIGIDGCLVVVVGGVGKPRRLSSSKKKGGGRFCQGHGFSWCLFKSTTTPWNAHGRRVLHGRRAGSFGIVVILVIDWIKKYRIVLIQRLKVNTGPSLRTRRQGWW